MLALLDIVGPDLDWRILSDGTLWIGSETWDLSSQEFQILNKDPVNGSADIGSEAPFVVPGIELDGIGKINRVEHHIMPNTFRSRVWTNIDTERGLQSAISTIAKQAIPGIDYFALYDANVNSQSTDKTTVDVTPGDPRLPGMQRVPLRHGVPGLSAQVVPGSKLRIGWDRGNPQLPFAALWDGGETVLSLSIGSSADNVLTKTDMTNLISAIVTMASTGNSGGPLTFVAPVLYGSTTISVQR